MMGYMENLNDESEREFDINNYDIIAFDLDNSLVEYNVEKLTTLQYKIMANYMVNKKGYPAELTIDPTGKELDFIRKGLFLDTKRGNILEIGNCGKIIKAAHGTQFLSNEQITRIYGQEYTWSEAKEFCQDMLVRYSDELSKQKLISLLDYFATYISLLFAKVIDLIDRKEVRKVEDITNATEYDIWSDFVDGFKYMYSGEDFDKNLGEYFAALKSNPEKFIEKRSERFINWMKQIKATGKISILITGSKKNYTNFIAAYSLGENWKELFDYIICNARKPRFFTDMRPFLDAAGVSTIDNTELKPGFLYNQGNWRDLYEAVAKDVSKKKLSSLYIGDNFIQDVYGPTSCGLCDAIVVTKELSETFEEEERVILLSNSWGCYFKDTFWGTVMTNHAVICVPTVSCLSQYELRSYYNEMSS